MQWAPLTLVQHESCTGALKASILGLNGLNEAFYLHFLMKVYFYDFTLLVAKRSAAN